MADVKVTCVCGAIYEVIETKGPSREVANCIWSGVLTRTESSS
jgi:hypothetical protein